MINKIIGSKPYTYTKISNTVQKSVTNTFRKYIGIPVAALTLAGASSVSSCVIDIEDEDDVIFYTCPHDSTEFRNNCQSTPERINLMFKTLNILPAGWNLDDMSGITYIEGDNNIIIKNIGQNKTGDLHCTKIQIDKSGNKDTTEINCKNIQGSSQYISVEESIIRNGQIQSKNSKFIYQSLIQPKNFLAKNINSEYLYALYPKSGFIIKETPSGQKETVKVTGYTKKQ